MQNGGIVTEIIDKPKETDHMHTRGCIIWKSRFTEFLNEKIQYGEADFAEIMNQAIQEGLPFRGITLKNAKYSDLGTYNEIVELERKYGILGEIHG